MNAFVSRYSTPLTLGLFAVSAVSGMALFFHLAPRAFHGMHEWLSIVLLVPFALHVWKNWAALVGYLRRGTMLVPVAACVLLGVALALPALTGGGGPPPQIRAVQLLTTAPLVELAAVLGTSAEELRESLAERGVQVGSDADSLATVAASAGTSAEELLFGLMPPG
jgi:hypothetical protein